MENTIFCKCGRAMKEINHGRIEINAEEARWLGESEPNGHNTWEAKGYECDVCEVRIAHRLGLERLRQG